MSTERKRIKAKAPKVLDSKDEPHVWVESQRGRKGDTGGRDVMEQRKSRTKERERERRVMGR